MTKLDKLKARLLQKPNDFTFQELETLLLWLGYEEKKTEYVNYMKFHYLYFLLFKEMIKVRK